MAWHCIAPDCNVSEEKNSDNVSAFSLPKNVDNLAKWKEGLGSDLIPGPRQAKPRVCEKHFDQDDINRQYYVKSREKVILNCPYQRKRLKSGAFPKLDPQNELNLQVAGELLVLAQCYQEQVMQQNFMTPDLEQVDNFGAQSPPEIPRDINCSNDLSGTPRRRSPRLCSKRILDDTHRAAENGNNDFGYTALTQNILDEFLTVRVPECEWGIHRSIQRKEVLFTLFECLPDSRKPVASKIVLNFCDF